MTKKHHFRKSIKSFFERHTDPEKHEKLKETRKDMEEKKKRILTLMESPEENDGFPKEEPKRGTLAELIEEFHRQYESLYSHYDHLTEELKKKVRTQNQKKETFSSSSGSGSDSDSDHSSKEKDSKNGKVETVEDLKVEVEGLDQEKSKLLAETEELKLRLESAVKTEVELNQQIEELVIKKDALNKFEEGNQNVESLKAQVDQLQSEKQSLELELEVNNLSQMREKREMQEQFESKAEEVTELRGQISQLQVISKEREEQISSLKEKLEADENEFNSRIEALREQVNNLTQEANTLLAANTEAYQGMITTISENVNTSLSVLESITRKFEDEHEKFLISISEMSQEIQVLKQCTMGKNIEIEQLKQEVQNERQQGSVMKEEINKLEVQAQRQNGEKEELLLVMSQQLKKAAGKLDMALKEKDEQISTLGEEKRQAIKQLCLWCDNVQSRYNDLKNMVLKSASQRQAE